MAILLLLKGVYSKSSIPARAKAKIKSNHVLERAQHLGRGNFNFLIPRPEGIKAISTIDNQEVRIQSRWLDSKLNSNAVIMLSS